MSVWGFSKKQLIQSMLVGVPQLIQVRGGLRKMLKTVVLLFCLSCCTYQIWSYMNVYWSYPVIVDVFVSYPNRIVAPAFSVCDHNGIKRTKFCRRFPYNCTPEQSYGGFCQRHFSFCRDVLPKQEPLKMPTITPMELPTNISNSRSIYRHMGTNEIDFIDSVEFRGVPSEPKRFSVFNMEGLPTNCFAFDVLWENITVDLKMVGLTDMYKIVLKSSSKEHFYAITPLAIQMAIHSPLMKVNPFTDGFSLRPCTTYKMYLRKVKKLLLPAPYPTNCTDYNQKRKEQGYGPLSQKNCIDECTFNRSISKYGCFDPQKINYPNEKDIFCQSSDIEEDLEDCTKHCRPGCYEEDMDVKIEELVYPLTEDKNAIQCKTVINLLFTRIQETSYTYSKKYQVVEAFGYIGGFLGMWLGLSLIAICDFAETCCVILVHVFKTVKCLRRRRKTAKVQFIPHKKLLYI